MVMEHFDDKNESEFMRLSIGLLKGTGEMIALVPASPAHWGIEDEIAGHYRRYTRAKLNSLANDNHWVIRHIVGLTYPISNCLLPISNFLVKQAESSKIGMSDIEKTKASGIRKVQFKTHFPRILSFVLNRHVLLPLHWLQKTLSSSGGALVLYFEAVPSQKSNGKI